jgi:thioredoxin-like negative regulator of GroEL
MRDNQNGQGQGPNRPGGQRPNDPLGRMLNYLEIVERYGKITKDGTSAGVAAVIAANDLLRPAGNKAAIEFFTKMLEETKNDTVKRAIRLQLVDLYRLTGDRDKALEHLKILMTEAPAVEEKK